MSETVGSVIVEVHARIDALEREIRRGTVRGAEKAGKDSGKIFGSSFKRNVAAFTGGLIGAGAIVGSIRSLRQLGSESLKAAADQSAANAVIGRAVRNAGAEMTVFGKSIEQALQAESLLTGIADDELSPAFARLVAVTRDSARAFELLQLSQDIFRVRGGSVVTAAQALAKAEGGQITALQRLLPLDKQRLAGLEGQAAATEALLQVTEQFGGQRISFAESDAGSLERAAVTFEEIKETLGQAILPTVAKIGDRIATWFSDPENQQRVEDGIVRTAQVAEDILKTSVAIGEALASPFVQLADDFTELGKAIDDVGNKIGSLNPFKNEDLEGRAIEEGIRQAIEKQRQRRPTGPGGPGDLTFETAVPGVRANRPGLQGVAGQSTFSGDLNNQIKRLQDQLRADLTESDADNLVLFKARQRNLQSQIDQVGDPRGKNDQQRLIRLFEELGDVQGDITNIERAAADARADAAADRKRLADEEKERVDQQRKDDAAQAQADREAANQRIKEDKERARALKESRLSLRVQQAELTKTNKDDKAAIRAQIRFYNDQAKNFRRSGAQALAVEAESKKVSARLALQGLRKPGSGTDSTAGGARVDFFQEAANQFRTFGSNIGRAGDPLSGQDARGQFAGFALDRRRNTANLEQDSLNEQQSQTSVLREIRDRLRVTTRAAEGNQPPNRRSPTATDIARVNARNQLAGR